MVLNHIPERLPGLLVDDESFANNSKCIQGKADDHSAWLVTCGTYMESVDVVLNMLAPGRSPTKLQVSPTDRVRFSDTSSELDILRTIQSNKKHENVAKLIAFSTKQPQMFAVEHYEVSLLQRLYNARGNNEELSIQWKVDRCLEMLRAIDFLHHQDVIHREIMARSFSLSYRQPQHEVAKLTSLSRAIVNDVTGYSTTQGHVRGKYLGS